MGFSCVYRPVSIGSIFLITLLFPLSAKQKEVLPPSTTETCKESPIPSKQTICLNMIVKNESAVIKRCLDSVKPFINYWVIVDTGSTDGTQKIIQECLKEIPGKLYERPWKNFGANRSEAIRLARDTADYLLLMDADDTLEYEKDFAFPKLTADLYYMWRGTKEFSYKRPQLVTGKLPWKFIGVTHEYIDAPMQYTTAMMEKIRYASGDNGARSAGIKKFLENIQLLEEGLIQEPHNIRYAFYLAESYRDAGQPAKALEWYQKRINMGGWDEEVFYSKLQLAHILRKLHFDPNLVIQAYLNSHTFRQHRLEPIYYLASFYNERGEYQKAYTLLKTKVTPLPLEGKDSLFNEDWIEEHGLLFQLSIAAYYTGNYKESLDLCDQLLRIKNLPEDSRKLTEENRVFPLEKLKLFEKNSYTDREK